MGHRDIFDMNRRGSFTVEAVILVPLFFLIWLPFLYILRYCTLYEVLQSAVHQTASTMASVGYWFQLAGFSELQETAEEGEQEGQDVLWQETVNTVGGLLAGQILEEGYPETLWQELGAQEEPQLQYSRYFYQDEEMSDWIHLVAVLPLQWPDPFGFFSDLQIVADCKVRAFIGLPNEAFYTEGEGKEEIGEEEETYYRIGNGRKYHSLHCYLIQKDIRMLAQVDALQQGLSSCERCEPTGQQVFVTAGGEHFHTDTCSYLFPRLIELSEAQIASGLYTPCALCQTENDWFT